MLYSRSPLNFVFQKNFFLLAWSRERAHTRNSFITAVEFLTTHRQIFGRQCFFVLCISKYIYNIFIFTTLENQIENKIKFPFASSQITHNMFVKLSLTFKLRRKFLVFCNTKNAAEITWRVKCLTYPHCSMYTSRSSFHYLWQ